MKRPTLSLAVAAVLAAATADACAQTVTDPKDLAASVQTLFQQRCVACHSREGAEKAGERLKTPFLNDLAVLRENAVVDLKNPEASVLYTTLVDGEMPRETKEEKSTGKKAELTSAEIAVVLSWIKAGAPAPGTESAAVATSHGTAGPAATAANAVQAGPAPAPEPAVAVALPGRPVITPVSEVSGALEDLATVRREEQHETRWISIAPMHNHAQTSEKDLEDYRRGVRKMLNSLSTAPEIARFEEAGQGKTLFRVRLRDLGWDGALWEKLASHYPLAVHTALSSTLQHGTGTAVPIIRADWLASQGMRPPLYHDLLRLPDSQQGLEKGLQVTVAKNLADGDAVRYALNPSGVSQANRLIERHPLGAYQGYYWLSYDFKRQNPNRVEEKSLLVKNPLGPESAHLLGGKHAFRHDGGEIVFSLRNGLHGYYISDVLGNRVDEAPVSVVFDQNLVTGRVEVSNGLSCVRCHANGIKEITKSNDVVFAVMNGFDPEALALLRQLHPGETAVVRQMDEDTRRYLRALQEAGATPSGFDLAKPSTLGDEPVGRLADWFDTPLNLSKVAAELGFTAGELTLLLGQHNSPAVFNNRITLVSGGKEVDRVDFQADFAELITRFHPDLRVKTDVAKLQTAGVSKLAHRRPVAVQLSTDKAVYQGRVSESGSAGDKPVLTVEVAEACHVRLLYQDAGGEITTLFPNKFEENDRVPAGKFQLLPRPHPGKPGEQIQIEIWGGPSGKVFGTERFILVAAEHPFTDEGELIAGLKGLPEGEVFLPADSGNVDRVVTEVALSATRAARVVVEGNGKTTVVPARSGISVVTVKTKPRH